MLCHSGLCCGGGGVYSCVALHRQWRWSSLHWIEKHLLRILYFSNHKLWKIVFENDLSATYTHIQWRLHTYWYKHPYFSLCFLVVQRTYTNQKMNNNATCTQIQSQIYNITNSMETHQKKDDQCWRIRFGCIQRFMWPSQMSKICMY